MGQSWSLVLFISRSVCGWGSVQKVPFLIKVCIFLVNIGLIFDSSDLSFATTKSSQYVHYIINKTKDQLWPIRGLG